MTNITLCFSYPNEHIGRAAVGEGEVRNKLDADGFVAALVGGEVQGFLRFVFQSVDGDRVKPVEVFFERSALGGDG